MSASPAESTRKTCVRIAFEYLLATIFTAFFGAVYETFSHSVYAYGMLYAFAFPLLFARKGKPLPGDAARQLWHFGISALTVGSLFSGALEIYGTTSRLTAVYWIAGCACLLLAVLIGLFVPAGAGEKAVANR